MKKNYKLLSLALAVLLCSVCLSACGSAGSAQTTAATTAATTTATTATTTATGTADSALQLSLDVFRHHETHSSPNYTYQFDYLEWGSSLDDVVLAFPSVPLERNTTMEPVDDPTVKVYSVALPVALDGQNTPMHFIFENEELIQIYFSFKPNDDGTWFNAQLEKLIELYGESTAASSDIAETHRWFTDISQLQITRMLKDNSVSLIVGYLPPAPEATITPAEFGSYTSFRFRGIDWYSSIEDSRAVLPFTFYRNSVFEPENDPTVAAYSSQTPITLDGLEGDLRLIYENEELVLAEFSFRPDDVAWFNRQLDAFTDLYGESDVIEFQNGKNYIWNAGQTLLQLTLSEGSRWTSATIKLGPLDE